MQNQQLTTAARRTYHSRGEANYAAELDPRVRAGESQGCARSAPVEPIGSFGAILELSQKQNLAKAQPDIGLRAGRPPWRGWHGARPASCARLVAAYEWATV